MMCDFDYHIESGPAALFPFDGVGFADAECNAYRRRSGFLLNAYLLQGGVKQKSTLLFVYFGVLTVRKMKLIIKVLKSLLVPNSELHALSIVLNLALFKTFISEFSTFVVMHKNGGAKLNTIYENITKLCEERGITGAKMCRDVGVGKSLLSSLKSGRTKSINAQTAVKIADYFSVPVDAITVGNTDRISTAEEIEKAAPVSESGVDAEVLELFRNAPEWKKKAALALLKAAEDGQ